METRHRSSPTHGRPNEGSSRGGVADSAPKLVAVAGDEYLSALGDARRELEAMAVERDLLEATLQEAMTRADRLQDAVDDFQASATFKLVNRARSLPLFSGAQAIARRVARVFGNRSSSSGDHPSELSASGEKLPFGGFASGASTSSPEAMIAQRPRAICICHTEWRGIRAATYGQGEAVLEVPGITSKTQMELLVRFIGKSGARTVVINGVPPGSIELARAIARRLSQTRTLFVFHGSTAQVFHGYSPPGSQVPDDAGLLDQVVELAQANVVAKIGFVKNGLAQYFERLGVEAVTLMNTVRLDVEQREPAVASDGRIHIGVFAPNLFHKNLTTQLVAASSVQGAVVHCIELPSSPYLHRSDARFVVHGMLPHHEFLSLLGSMHVNLYASLTECYPMTVVESVAAGVPCLTSHTSALFDESPDLFRDLVVTAHDSPEAILVRILDVLERRKDITRRAQQHVRMLNEQAKQRWEAFLA